MTDVIHKVLNDIVDEGHHYWWRLIQECQRVAFGADSEQLLLHLATGEASMQFQKSKVTFKGV
jgi:aconitase B